MWWPFQFPFPWKDLLILKRHTMETLGQMEVSKQGIYNIFSTWVWYFPNLVVSSLSPFEHRCSFVYVMLFTT